MAKGKIGNNMIFFLYFHEYNFPQVLVDWVSSIKSKYTKIKNDMEKTGGGPFTNIQLNPQEERLMALKGLSSVEGDGETREMGLPEAAMQSIVSTNSTEIADLSVSDHRYSSNEWVANEIILANEEDAVPKKKRKVHPTVKKTIDEMHEETLGELKNINASLGTIADSLKSLSDCLKKVYSCDV